MVELHVGTASRRRPVRTWSWWSAGVGRSETLLVFVGTLCLLVALGAGQARSFDGQVMFAVARAIAHGHLRLTITEPPFSPREGPDFLVQLPYAHYGIGQSLVMLPLYLMAKAFGANPEHVIVLANPLEEAATAAVLFRIGLAHGWSRGVAMAITLATIFGTMLLQASQELFSEPGVTLGLTVALLGVLRLRAGTAGAGFLMGAGAGVALLFRTDSLILVALPLLVAALLFLRAERPGQRLFPQVCGAALGFVPALAWTVFYSELSSGRLIPSSYGDTFSTPFATGFYGLVIGPSKGFFFYNPWLLLALPGFVILFRRDRVWAVLLFVLWIGRACLYARWSAWFGGVCWGPRFLTPGVVPLALVAGDAWVSLRSSLKGARRRLGILCLGVLAALSAMVSILSIWVTYTEDWDQIPLIRTPPHASPALAAQIAASNTRLATSASQSALWKSFTHLSHAVPFGLAHFRHGPTPTGLALVLAGLACTGAAAWKLRTD